MKKQEMDKMMRGGKNMMAMMNNDSKKHQAKKASKGKRYNK